MGIKNRAFWDHGVIIGCLHDGDNWAMMFDRFNSLLKYPTMHGAHVVETSDHVHSGLLMLVWSID